MKKYSYNYQFFQNWMKENNVQINEVLGPMNTSSWKNRRVLTPFASFRLTLENFSYLTRISVLAGGSFLFWFT